MDTSKAKKTKGNTNKDRKTAEIRSTEVSNVRVVEGKNGDVVFFTLTLNDVTIYNCRVATGKNGDFISFPQYKSKKDDKYYNNVYVALSEEDSAKILETIQNELNK
jgi:DNA-binding cell septation regulator SpoVG